MLNESIFKSYDIRGIYPGELNEETAKKIGQAFVNKTGARKIAVARDGRLSSEALSKALVEGILSQGADVYEIGQAPTEALYFSVGFYGDIDAGIMITASHNPKEYNGFKLVEKKGNRVDVIRGKDLLEFVKKDADDKGKGKVVKKDIWKDYSSYIFSKVDASAVKPLKVVVDASNGMAGKAISIIKSKIPIEIIEINFNIDGNFPSHSPNPLVKGSINQISQAVKDKGADFGCVFDGDGDRVFLIDEKGIMVPADITLLFLAKYFLENNFGASISYNVICSKAVPQFIKKWGGKPIKTKVGFVNVREGIMKNDGIMGGELSGHYCFKDFFYFDSGIIAFLSLLKVISESGKKVSEMAKELSIYFKASEMNFEIKDKDEVLEKIKKKYADGEQNYLDGITVEYKDWWFNVRASNTEPVLRLTIEADTKEILEEKQKELISFIA
ncbi:MAG: phosphomannomutase/phosphoglucomutase [Candidatus Nealsonbacteria bacterium]|nr:phosphomannomutase/phosphoglucomutase [Candidatus Nealsonbacteria bacterium]